jgi:uncharacterized protein (DUF1684 family)
MGQRQDWPAKKRRQQSYSPHWSCPIPPKENRLKVAVRAGEKVFEGEGHE